MIKTKTAVVCIAKNEDRYIQEWIDYNLKLGFDDIYIYMNDWRCKLDITNPAIKFIRFDGKCKQIEAYKNFIVNYAKKYIWAAFIDVDEFICLKKHSNINEFLKDYESFNGVALNWAMFVSKTDSDEEKKGAVKRFFYREQTQNKHVKIIVNLKRGRELNMIVSMCNPHYINGIEIVDVKKNVILNTPFNKNNTIDIAQINHYHYKTFDEYKLQIARGRASSHDNMDINNWNNQSPDIVKDMDAYNFMYSYT